MIPWLDKDTPFPSTHRALENPNGLLAAGGSLDVSRLLEAYRKGIFPWPMDGHLLWWSPSPRMVLLPSEFKCRRALAKRIRNGGFCVRFDTDFPAVIRACATTGERCEQTWIEPRIRKAYVALHKAGFAHSVETWREGKLVGGLYGVAIGRIFYGESMFSVERDASKVALAHLCAWLHAQGFLMIDCQMYTPHLASLGARELLRSEFEALLEKGVAASPPVGPGSWAMATYRVPALPD
jgi:leucyl/phenylalanyl-tRNA---protein transferase